MTDALLLVEFKEIVILSSSQSVEENIIFENWNPVFLPSLRGFVYDMKYIIRNVSYEKYL